MSNGSAQFRGLELAPQVIYGPYGYWVIYPQAAPPNQIHVKPGDTVRFNVQFQHRGAAYNGYLLGALGTRPFSIFNPDERLMSAKSLAVGDHSDWTTVSIYIDIAIPQDYADLGWKGAQAKIGNTTNWNSNIKIESPDYGSAVEIVEWTPDFQGLAITGFVKA